MLKDFLKAWADGGLMKQAVGKLGGMLGDVEYEFNHAWETCLGQTVAEKIADQVKAHDKAVNAAEREIRRLVVEHLTINPGRDVSGCLALLLMAKDAERLGDHARNVFDIGCRLEGRLDELEFGAACGRFAGEISALLPMLQRAVVESDEGLTHEILERYQALKNSIKETNADLQNSSLAAAEAVPVALLLRYFRRINAHLGNIASGIIFPLENIDFVSRGLREEEKER
jgi:phosphate uptake regulator